MAKINLLPWRVTYREEKKKEFIGIMFAVAIFALLLAFLWVLNIQGAIEYQGTRNTILKAEITALDKKVKEINELKEQREELLVLMKLIRDLEGTRAVVVHHFDDLVKAVPDGVFLTKVERVENVMTIEGYAESNNRVSSFMRNLDSSEWYDQPNLSSVDAAPEEGEQANKFLMSVNTIVSKAQAALQEQQEGQ